jgi:hypothetical protein
MIVGLACGGADDSGGDPEQPPDVSRSCSEVCAHWRSVGCGDPLSDCYQNCTSRWSTDPGAACSDQIVAYYACEVRRPSSEYLCQGSLPTYNGTACSAEDSAAQVCISAQAESQRSCEQYCDLLVSECGTSDIEGCKQSCANLSLFGECADEATAFYDCVAPLAPSRLSCDSGQLKPADGTCDVALNALVSCAP